uniref:ATP synthase subunit 8 n=1 Tax=Nothoaspis amazoniensis TaxID=765744 RepID=A0A1P8LFX5_9ACAR|nr:ATP synthase subunit 8 [Nothoaspis amazoniensis]APW83512.1 ATP synthase subunit 8 [Nothoaspis amazoniensis]
MNWNLLIIFFSLILILTTSMMYFNFIPNIQKSIIIKKTMKKNWSW